MGKKGAPTPEPPPVVEEEKVEEEPPLEQHEGEFCWPDGSSFAGQYFTKGEKRWIQGKGKLQTGQEVFDGDFDQQGFYKEGTYMIGERTVYEGKFRNNLFHGPGTYYWPDGRTYRGMFQNGVMHGRGDFENFSFGIDKVFSGFAIKGDFKSSLAAQAESREVYLKEYTASYAASASAMLTDLLSKLQPPEPADPKEKGKKKGEVEDVAVPIPKEFIVPPQPAEDAPAAEDPAAEAEAKEASAVRATVAELVSGPFPETVKLESLKHFAAHFAKGAEKPGAVTVLDTTDGLVGGRLKQAQLEHYGQGVELQNPHAEPAALKAIVVVNISSSYCPEETSWRIVHTEDAPVPEDHDEHDHKKGKKR
mmetsp:Transcript_54517/g.130013  ORF Transcript_54517/g.130013 Transcript_54517/m.130013 type:complete len:363 (-) Transcript_54517:72-1160(-)